FNSSDLLTPAEFVAAMQVESQGVQMLNLSSLGNAIGGRLSISSALAQSINNLLVPQGVKLLDNTAKTGLITLGGDLTNEGTIVVYSSSVHSNQGGFSAANILNASGGLITSVASVANLGSGIRSSVSNLSLSLGALDSF